ncbi:MAG: hypothetical protein OXG13_04040 [Gemmatimonadaceae bacterium]|nr:hypothetical protein [Gemmatimonadaceae bacterium]
MVTRAEFYTYPWDLSDEGVVAASGVIADTLGPGGGVLLTLSYHVSTYFSPRNPRRKIYFGEEGAVYFQPDESLYGRTGIRPLVSQIVTGPDYLPGLVRGIGERGLEFSAWAIYLYNHHLSQAFPDTARHDCFGEPHLGQLCPAHPDVRAYALALTRDMVRFGPRHVQIESPGYLGFGYGFRNPKVAVAIDPLHQFLMGLCFCRHCVEAANGAGVDGERLRAEVAADLDRELRLEPGDGQGDRDEWIEISYDGRLGSYLEARTATATSLFEEVAAAVREGGAGVSFFGSLDRATTGLDRRRVLASVDAVYTSVPGPPEEAVQGVQKLRDDLAPEVRLVSIVRPGGFEDESWTRRLIHSQAEAGVDGFAFYTYGQLREHHLAWIRGSRDAWS